MKYVITAAGREGLAADFANKQAAVEYLRTCCREDLATCRRKYGQAKATRWDCGYKVEFGCNLFSSLAVHPLR